LRDNRTTFVVVTTLEAAPVHEAAFFIDALQERSFDLGALVLNRVLPDYLLDERASALATRLTGEAATVAKRLAPELGSPELLERVLVEIADSFLRFELVARYEAEQRRIMSAAPDVVASVPYYDRDIHDLAGLLRLGEALWT
jgi:anion-transporting  ArsA/GET3 family ATPase